MRSYNASLLVLVLVAACQSPRKPPVSLPTWDVQVSTPTPTSFVIGQPWNFVEIDNQDQIVRSFTIVFTADRAPTCIGGDWLLANVAPRPSAMIGNTAAFSVQEGAPQPAYLLEGSALAINLTSGICDWADEFVGQLKADGFVGYAREEGLGHYKVKGAVYGSPVHGSGEPDT